MYLRMQQWLDQDFKKYVLAFAGSFRAHAVPLCTFGRLRLFKDVNWKRKNKCIFFHCQTSTRTTTNHFRSCRPVCLPNCQHCHGCMFDFFHFFFFFFHFSPASLVKMARTWLCRDHKAANHPACARMFSHGRRALVRIPTWGRASLAPRPILASFFLLFRKKMRVVRWREAQLSRWPPRWVDGNEESKVSRVERFYVSKEGVCLWWWGYFSFFH